jgi:pyridoxamine 5'-phosphate oxidase
MPTRDASQSPPDPAGLRREYSVGELNESEVANDALEQFGRWFSDANSAGVLEPNAMALATVNVDGQPTARIVLLKGFDSRGFEFHSNYTSRKGRELDENPRAALLFFWAELERQVRIDGSVEKLTRAESEAYFHVRPVESQLGAWVSHQSAKLESREQLKQRQDELRKRFAGGEIPVPPFWGGYRLIPAEIEFWQGRPSRLHDRLLYVRTNNAWAIQRLSP